MKLKDLERKMDTAIDSENYESAANLREDIDKLKEKIKKAKEKDDRSNKRDELESKFDEIKEKHEDFKADVFFPGNELPGLGENVDVYDYEEAFDKLRDKAEKVIEIMVLNIFNNDKAVLEDSLVKEKMNDDIDSYADLKFAAEMSRRLFMNGLKDLDNGAQSSRMYEVVSKMQSEMRQNNKMLNSMMKEFNSSYRQLKEDMAERLLSKEEEDNTNIIDMKDMNGMIQEHLEKKRKKRIEEKRKSRQSEAAAEEDDFNDAINNKKDGDLDEDTPEDTENNDKEKGDN